MDEHSPDLAIEHWPLVRLEPYARNARTHSDEQVARLAASIVEFGWTVPVLIDADGTVIAGHGRLLAAEQLGLDSAPVIRLEHLSPAQARAYRIADNRLTELGGWNDELLSNELHQLNGEGFDLALTGFDGAELDRLMEPLDHAPGRAGEDDDTDDDAPVPPREAIARPGDLWLLGDHRLLCGDSTDGDTVTRVMDRERAALLFTSPPYGEQRDYTTGGIGDWDALMRGVFAAPPMTDDGQILVNLGLIHRDGEWQPYWENWIAWMREQGWRRFGLYVWDQGPGLAGDWHGRLAPSFELIFHFNRETRRPNKTVPCVSAGHIHREGKGDLRDKDGTSGTWTHAGRPVQEMRIPDSVMQAELRRIERAVPDGVKAAGDGLKGSLRKQVIAAGLGARLSRTWRGRTYANKGHDAASLVWSKAAQIVRAFDEGVVIKGKGGNWLAIPTPAAPKRGVGGKRITPATFPTARFGPLRMVRRSGRAALLVIDGVRVSAQTGRVGRWAKGGGRTKSGSFKQGIATVVMFVLMPRVKLRKRLNVARVAERWTRRLPGLIGRKVRRV